MVFLKQKAEKLQNTSKKIKTRKNLNLKIDETNIYKKSTKSTLL